MPCDPNALLEDAKCLESCLPPGMVSYAMLSVLCEIAEGGIVVVGEARITEASEDRITEDGDTRIVE